MPAAPVAAPDRVLRGIWPALLTPLLPAGPGYPYGDAIDTPRFVAHARQLLAAGCGGVTPFGTTGEGPSFSVDERIAAVQALVDGGIPGERILVSTSCAAVSDVITLTRHALAIGAWGCLLMPPFYFKGVSPQGVIDGYARVIDAVGDARLRLMLYHLPQVGGVPLEAEVVEALVQRYPGTVVGIKDSAGQLEASLVRAASYMPPLGVHVGHEPHLRELARRGSRGAVSGLANALPKAVAHLVDAPDASADTDARIQSLLQALNRHSLIPAIRGLMAIVSGDEAWLRVRPPLVALTPQALQALKDDWQAIAWPDGPL